MKTLNALRAGRLHGATRLTLSCGLTHFPSVIFDLADTLGVLDLSGKALTVLPHEMLRLSKLRVLFCSDNPFTPCPRCWAISHR